jgi:hypothetical protein
LLILLVLANLRKKNCVCLEKYENETMIFLSNPIFLLSNEK